ncbi:MAG: cobalamin-dependent protein [Phycisphaerae bacterium]|nr:cobalamin-dependent protein [Phycisphaerae bacterium]
MAKNPVLERYLDTLLSGDRKACRTVIEESLQTGTPANAVYSDIIWPIMVEIEHLVRSDKITTTQEHLATRINRTIVDQLQNKLPRKPRKEKRIVISCAQAELQELGAQIMADLFESDGWEVKFLGGGLTNEDVLEFINGSAPDILLIYGSTPKQAPDIRQLIDSIRRINAWPDMRIMVSGGLFNRADGLWQEIGADLFAATALEALQVASKDTPIDQNAGTGRRRKRGVKMVKEVQAEVLQ